MYRRAAQAGDRRDRPPNNFIKGRNTTAVDRLDPRGLVECAAEANDLGAKQVGMSRGPLKFRGGSVDDYAS
jgi:hypothetical protein